MNSKKESLQHCRTESLVLKTHYHGTRARQWRGFSYTVSLYVPVPVPVRNVHFGRNGVWHRSGCGCKVVEVEAGIRVRFSKVCPEPTSTPNACFILRDVRTRSNMHE